MRILTSSWFTRLPPEIQKIGISRGTPRGYPAGYRKLMSLAPGSWFNRVGVPEYKRLYFEALALLDPRKVVGDIETLANGRDCALLCYEAPHKDSDWCHRGFVSAWLNDELGLEIHEFGLEDRGAGWRHPKIPFQFRLPPQQPEPLHVGPYVGATATDGNGVVWKVVGFDPDNIDQALVENPKGVRKPISGDVLHSRFQPVL